MGSLGIRYNFVQISRWSEKSKNLIIQNISKDTCWDILTYEKILEIPYFHKFVIYFWQLKLFSKLNIVDFCHIMMLLCTSDCYTFKFTTIQKDMQKVVLHRLWKISYLFGHKCIINTPCRNFSNFCLIRGVLQWWSMRKYILKCEI